MTESAGIIQHHTLHAREAPDCSFAGMGKCHGNVTQQPHREKEPRRAGKQAAALPAGLVAGGLPQARDLRNAHAACEGAPHTFGGAPAAPAGTST